MPNFTIGTLKGRRCVTWVKPDGRRARFRLSGGTPTELQAEAIEIWRRENPPPKEARIALLWEGYRSELDGRPTAETMIYTGIPVLKHFGELRPDQISPEICKSYSDKRSAEGKSQGTIWTELVHLQSTLNWAHGRGLIARKIKVVKPSKPAPADRYFTKEEIGRLLGQPGTPHHIRLAMLLMLTTAARVSALLELTWDRVDLDRRQINLRTPGSATRKGRAIVPINNGLFAALSEAQVAGISDYVIEWAGKKVGSIRKGLETAGAAAGVSEVSAHIFRHTAAVHMAEAGIPMSEISQFLGHTNTTITERVYARYSPSHLQRAAAVLDFSPLNKGNSND